MNDLTRSAAVCCGCCPAIPCVFDWCHLEQPQKKRNGPKYPTLKCSDNADSPCALSSGHRALLLGRAEGACVASRHRQQFVDVRGIRSLSGMRFCEVTHFSSFLPQNVDSTSAAVRVCVFGSCVVNNAPSALSFSFLQRVCL